MKSPIPIQRVASKLHHFRIPILPQLLTYFIRIVYGCYLPHTAVLGKRVVLGYGGIGIVIHAASQIGCDTIIGQGVTLGGDSKRIGAPQIGDRVYIGAGSKNSRTYFNRKRCKNWSKCGRSGRRARRSDRCRYPSKGDFENFGSE